MWERLDGLHRAGEHRQEFAAAWANGQAFLRSEDGLRGRPPQLVEWKGPTQAPGDEVVPMSELRDYLLTIVEMSYQAFGYRRVKNPRIWSLHDIAALSEPRG